MLTPPKHKAPPLNALRAFESAARLGGFTAAAAELSVTPGAVAQQIKSLEVWAGAVLFERMSQGVRLTELGKQVSLDFGVAFDLIGQASNKLRSGAVSKQIRIAVLPSVAQLWLSNRLPQARTLVPDVNISITALDRAPNLLREPYDLSLFFYDQSELSDHAVKICADRIFPVCSPLLAESLKQPSDLKGLSFLHDTSWLGDWKNWLDDVCPEQLIDSKGPSFSLYSLAVQEAQNDAGVLIGHEPLVRAAIQNGSLVAPFSDRIELPHFLAIDSPGPVLKGNPVAKIIEFLCA